MLIGSACSLQGISEGMQPPSPLATTLTTLSCIGLVVWTFVSHGRATSGLAVMSFAVLSLQLLGTEKPRFSQLTSSVFGMFYCGERRSSRPLQGTRPALAATKALTLGLVPRCLPSMGPAKPVSVSREVTVIVCPVDELQRGAGYLPSFWIKLRMLSAPAVNTVLARHYPVRAPPLL